MIERRKESTCNAHATRLRAVLIGEEDCPFCQLEEDVETNKAFTIKPISSFPPGANPMIEDFENMGTSLGDNVMVLHKTFPHEEMTWMVLVHIPSGRRIKIVFPEEAEHLMSPEEAIDVLSGEDTGVHTFENEVTIPTSTEEMTVEESINALIDLGVEAAVKEQHSELNADTQPVYPGRYSKGGKE